MKLLITLFCAIGLVFYTHAQKPDTPSPILFIYDASGSMWGQLEGKTKKEIAANVLSETVTNLPANQNIGLIAYGHRTKGDCDDIEYMVDLSNNSKDKVTQAVKNINSLGKTPLARSATMAINSLRETKATIILITDGIESCDGNICDVVSSAKAEGINFKLHIVGFGLKEGESEQLKCAANAGDGHYYDVADAGGLSDVLSEVTTKTVDVPNVNFSIYAVKNGEPVDAWVKALKAGTNDEVDAARTYRDTGFVYLPPGKYDLVIKPLENTDVSGIKITVESKENKIGHETVSFDSGKINVTTLNNGEGWDATVNIYPKGSNKRISGGRTYGRTQDYEVNPGTYDVEIGILRIEGIGIKHRFEDVQVNANEATVVEHNFKSGIAMIGVKSGDELVDATVNFYEKTTQTNVAAARTYTSENSNPKEFILNPGIYEVKIMAVKKEFGGKKDAFTIEVKQGETVTKIINF